MEQKTYFNFGTHGNGLKARYRNTDAAFDTEYQHFVHDFEENLPDII